MIDLQRFDDSEKRELLIVRLARLLDGVDDEVAVDAPLLLASLLCRAADCLLEEILKLVSLYIFLRHVRLEVLERQR